MAATTLKQFWNDEATRLRNNLDALATELALAGGEAIKARDALSVASSAVSAQAAAVEAARRALAGIPMPGDGDPLLAAMETALAALADARASSASSDARLQAADAEFALLKARQAALQAEAAEVSQFLAEAEKAAQTRKGWGDALTSGAMKTLVADATAALASEAVARTRVTSLFPSNATASKDFLKRVAARRALAQDSAAKAAATEASAFAANADATAQARRAFDTAAEAVRWRAEAAARLAADATALQRLAALPALDLTKHIYPLITRWQYERLNSAALKADREAALAKLKAVDDAQAEAQTAEAAYDAALHAAMKANPDTARAALDAGPLATEKGTLTAKRDAVAAKWNAMTASEKILVKTWFAAVPDVLWDALETLETSAARLAALKNTAPATLITAMAAAEAALVTALDTARTAVRKRTAASLAGQRAAARLAAESGTAGSRAAALAHAALPF